MGAQDRLGPSPEVPALTLLGSLVVSPVLLGAGASAVPASVPRHSRATPKSEGGTAPTAPPVVSMRGPLRFHGVQSRKPVVDLGLVCVLLPGAWPLGLGPPAPAPWPPSPGGTQRHAVSVHL